MAIRTAEDFFDYQMKQVLSKLHQEYKDLQSEIPFNEWLWQNSSDLGKAIYERYDEYAGIDTLIEEIESES